MIFEVKARFLCNCCALGCTCCVFWLCAMPSSRAQTAPTAVPRQPSSQAPSLTGAKRPAASHSTNEPRKLSDSEAINHGTLVKTANEGTQLATVILSDGKLTVNANNSDLSQILQEIAGISGMTINGLNGGPRVFGVYGPGNSREVLTVLLVDSGYNFIMVGGASDSTPRELLLTARNITTSGPKSLNPSSVRPVADSEESRKSEPEVDSSDRNAMGPGAVPPVPSLNDQGDAARAQANLLRLQHQQEQQQQQSAPQ